MLQTYGMSRAPHGVVLRHASPHGGSWEHVHIDRGQNLHKLPFEALAWGLPKF